VWRKKRKKILGENFRDTLHEAALRIRTLRKRRDPTFPIVGEERTLLVEPKLAVKERERGENPGHAGAWRRKGPGIANEEEGSKNAFRERLCAKVTRGRGGSLALDGAGKTQQERGTWKSMRISVSVGVTKTEADQLKTQWWERSSGDRDDGNAKKSSHRIEFAGGSKREPGLGRISGKPRAVVL